MNCRFSIVDCRFGRASVVVVRCPLSSTLLQRNLAADNRERTADSDIHSAIDNRKSAIPEYALIIFTMTAFSRL